jgi:hypothetical protein
MQVGDHVITQKSLYTGLFVIGKCKGCITRNVAIRQLTRYFLASRCRRYPSSLDRRTPEYPLLARGFQLDLDHGTRQPDGARSRKVR